MSTDGSADESAQGDGVSRPTTRGAHLALAGVPLPKLAILNPKHDPFLAGTRRLADSWWSGPSLAFLAAASAPPPCSRVVGWRREACRASLARRRLRHVGGGIRGAHEFLETLVCEQLPTGAGRVPRPAHPDHHVAPRTSPRGHALRRPGPAAPVPPATVLDALSRSTALRRPVTGRRRSLTKIRETWTRWRR